MKFPVSSQHFISILIFISLTFVESVTCRRLCYSCSTKENGLNCLNNPQNVTDGTVPCKFYCTIKRIEYGYQEISTPSTALNRTCEEQPMNGAFQDIYFITYYRACKTNLCNGGDGRGLIISLKKNMTEGELEDDDMIDLIPGSSSILTFDIMSRSNLLILFLNIYYNIIFIYMD